MLMKAIRVHRPGGPEVLQIEELPRPEPVSYTHLTLPTN